MFDGRYFVAVSPEGAITLPPAVRREMQRLWGTNPELLCFGVQFLYISRVDQAEALLRRIDNRLCAGFGHDMRQVNAYFRAMDRSVAQLNTVSDGRFVLPQQQRNMLGVPSGGLLVLLGVDDHLELWNREELEAQTRLLEQKELPGQRGLLETPICLQSDDEPCSLLKDGLPVPKRCGPCVYLRLP